MSYGWGGEGSPLICTVMPRTGDIVNVAPRISPRIVHSAVNLLPLPVVATLPGSGERGQIPFNTPLLLFVVIFGHGSGPLSKLVDSQPFIQQAWVVDG